MTRGDAVRIRLIDIDSRLPNIALMKLSAYYKSRGHTISFDEPEPDRVYVSVIFKENAWKAKAQYQMFPNAEVIVGGSGVDLQKRLPDAIEYCKPDYDLYPSSKSQGFASRGCVRNCEFCIVPIKEGRIKPAQHPAEFHDDRFKTCMLMDNNLFAAPRPYVRDVFKWFIDSGIRMDMTQGFDIRLLNEEYAGLLAEVKHETSIRFAWDNINDQEKIDNGIKLLKDAGINLKQWVSFYVLCGFNTTFEQDLYRCNHLRELGANSYVMQYRRGRQGDPELRKLAKWANRRWAYWSGPYITA